MTKSEKWIIAGIIAIVILIAVNFVLDMKIKHTEEAIAHLETILELEEKLMEARKPEPKELGVVIK